MFETNLKAYSFEVVVAGLVLHLQGCSFEDSLRWIATLKAAINNSPPDDSDPLLSEALRLEDTFYYVRKKVVSFLGGGGHVVVTLVVVFFELAFIGEVEQRRQGKKGLRETKTNCKYRQEQPQNKKSNKYFRGPHHLLTSNTYFLVSSAASVGFRVWFACFHLNA